MTTKKKQVIADVVDEYLETDMTAEEAVAAVDAKIHVLEQPKPKPRPGAKDFDWQEEFSRQPEHVPGEEIYVFTSEDGLTIGLAKLGPKRKPKPGLLRTYHRQGGMSVMWYFIELASCPASLKLQDELDEDDYTKMLRGWADFAGIELSE